MSTNSIKNIGKLLNKLNELGVDARAELKDSVNKNIYMVQGEAKLMCPVDTGALRNSITKDIKVQDNTIAGTVNTNYETAPYIEFGTGKKGENSGGDKYPGPLSYKQDKWLVNIPDVGPRWTDGQPAQPFLYPALKNNEKRIIDSIRSDLEKKIQEVSNR